MSKTTFRNLGNHLVEVSLAPSTSLYTRKSSLVASFAPLNELVIVSSSTSIRSSGLFQKILSRAPLKALISPSRQGHTLTVIDLDGTIDWVLPRPKTLHSFWGDSLAIQYRRPWLTSGLSILRKLTAPRPKHLLLSGRGLVALSSPGGDVQKVTVEEGQSFVINSKALLAYSVDSNLGDPISQIVAKQITASDLRDRNSPESKKQSVIVDDFYNDLPSVKDAVLAKDYSGALKSAWYSTVKFSSRLFSMFKTFTSPSYQLVKGPTTLYLASPVSTLAPERPLGNLISQFSIPEPTLDQLIHKQALQIVTNAQNQKIQAENSGLTNDDPQHHLKIASVDNSGKVTFASTSSFKNIGP